jgi:hypothetical protein
VFPWTDWTHFYVRGGGTATAQLVAREIGVPAAKWKGQRIDQSSDVATKVATSNDPEKTIGFEMDLARALEKRRRRPATTPRRRRRTHRGASAD